MGSAGNIAGSTMRIALVLAEPPETVTRIEGALRLRGHRVAVVDGDAGHPELPASDLIVVDAELAARTDLVEALATSSPGIEFVLVGPRTGASHPDVIDQLARPIDLDRLLAIVDEVADVLDGEKFREPIDLVAYETLFAGDSPQIRELLRRMRLIARSDAPAWIFGDDGSGRSIIARAIHDRSERRKQPYVAINCAAHSDDELARRLFTGDDAAVTTARGGSLFIERIAMSGPATQRALVSYLERQEPGPRLIIGMHRDKLGAGTPQFATPELYYRLKVHEIEIPTLKQRARDLEQIVGRMLGRLAADGKAPQIAGETMRLLERYNFPGNLLELAHALTHAYVLARGDVIQPQHLPITIRKATSDGEQARLLDGELEALDVVAKRFERDYLLRVLRSVAGNRGRAAEVLGLSRKGLWGKLKAHGISDDDIDQDEPA
jgi:DNA-binding NtrC family response regulator